MITPGRQNITDPQRRTRATTFIIMMTKPQACTYLVVALGGAFLLWNLKLVQVCLRACVREEGEDMCACVRL